MYRTIRNYHPKYEYRYGQNCNISELAKRSSQYCELDLSNDVTLLRGKDVNSSNFLNRRLRKLEQDSPVKREFWRKFSSLLVFIIAFFESTEKAQFSKITQNSEKMYTFIKINK